MQVLSRRRGSALVGSARSRCRSRRSVAGFTMVELMITLAVALVLIIVAVPSFKQLMLSNRLTTTANSMVGSINGARMEAIKLNANTQFCSNDSTTNKTDVLGAACNTQTVPTAAVYVTVAGAATSFLAPTTNITTPIQLKNNVKALRFSGQGLSYDPGTSTLSNGTVADICTSSMSTNNHRLIKITTGSILATSSSSGGCP